MAATFTSDHPVKGLVVVATITDAATANYDYTVTRPLRLFDGFVNKTEGATGAFANTVQALNGAVAITNAASINGAADNAVVRFSTLSDASNLIAINGTLRIAVTKAGGNAAVDVYLHCVPA